jgi:hypothetical protein
VKGRKGIYNIPFLFVITPLIVVVLLLSFAEAQKEERTVKVLNNRLSVDLMDAEFGSVMKEIGEMAGFEVKISAAISNKTLSTSFRDMELQRGINRLLTLISQKNYFIYYGPDNSISRIEVFVPKTGPGRTSATKWKPGPRPKPKPKPKPRPKPRPIPDRPRHPMQPDILEQAAPPDIPALTGNTPAGEELAGEKPAGKKPEGEEPEQKRVPYIPPTQVPAYIPPAKDKP